MENKTKIRRQIVSSTHKEIRGNNGGDGLKLQSKFEKNQNLQNVKAGKANKTRQRSVQDKNEKNKKSTRKEKLNADKSEKKKPRKKTETKEEVENETESDSDSDDSIAGYGEVCRRCSRGKVKHLFENAGVELSYSDYVPRSLNSLSP